MALPENWEDDEGQEVDAPFLNELCGDVNSAKADLDVVEATLAAGFTAAKTVATSETLTSASYGDLTTADSVSVKIGASGVALVFLQTTITNNAAGGARRMGFAISGATTRAPDDAVGVSFSTVSAASTVRDWFLVTGLTPGVNVFDPKFKSTISSPGVWAARTIAVIPF